MFGGVRSATVVTDTPCELFSLCCNCTMSHELVLSLAQQSSPAPRRVPHRMGEQHRMVCHWKRREGSCGDVPFLSLRSPGCKQERYGEKLVCELVDQGRWTSEADPSVSKVLVYSAASLK